MPAQSSFHPALSLPRPTRRCWPACALGSSASAAEPARSGRGKHCRSASPRSTPFCRAAACRAAVCTRSWRPTPAVLPRPSPRCCWPASPATAAVSSGAAAIPAARDEASTGRGSPPSASICAGCWWCAPAATRTCCGRWRKVCAAAPSRRYWAKSPPPRRSRCAGCNWRRRRAARPACCSARSAPPPPPARRPPAGGWHPRRAIPSPRPSPAGGRESTPHSSLSSGERIERYASGSPSPSRCAGPSSHRRERVGVRAPTSLPSAGG